jgi:transposase
MRGKPQVQPLFLAVLNLNATVPPNDPLCAIKRQMDAMPQKLSRLFEELYEPVGRPSIPPTRLLQVAEAA